MKIIARIKRILTNVCHVPKHEITPIRIDDFTAKHDRTSLLNDIHAIMAVKSALERVKLALERVKSALERVKPAL